MVKVGDWVECNHLSPILFTEQYKLIQDEKGNPIGSAIEHFKMDGTPVAKYVFDRAVSLAHVDLKLKKIFAYEQQMDKDQIIVYDLL